MKQIYQMLSLCLAFLLFSCLLPVSASDVEITPSDTAESVINAFIQESGLVKERVAVGYYNTVTGEEYYFNGDTYFPTASMYKVSLCMYYAEQIHGGLMDWDTDVWGLPLNILIPDTIIHSNNKYAGMLFGALGKYEHYRALTAKYFGIDPEQANRLYLSKTQNTPRQMIYNLKELYTNSEKYPKILEYMRQANPGRYFDKTGLPYDIAQKYGYLDAGHLHVNCCAIVYTDSPFLLVMFTTDAYKAETRLGELCALMCEYTQARVPSPSPTSSPSPTPKPTPIAASTPTPIPEPVVQEENKTPAKGILIGGGLMTASLVAAAVFLATSKKRNRK